MFIHRALFVQTETQEKIDQLYSIAIRVVVSPAFRTAARVSLPSFDATHSFFSLSAAQLEKIDELAFAYPPEPYQIAQCQQLDRRFGPIDIEVFTSVKRQAGTHRDGDIVRTLQNGEQTTDELDMATLRAEASAFSPKQPCHLPFTSGVTRLDSGICKTIISLLSLLIRRFDGVESVVHLIKEGEVPKETAKVYEKHSGTKGLILAIVDIPLSIDVQAFLRFAGPVLTSTIEHMRVLRYRNDFLVVIQQTC